MKCLTIHQPWASLVAQGVKNVENRTWLTNHRGVLLVHAGKATDGPDYFVFPNDFELIPGWHHPGPDRYGAIIGAVRVHDVLYNDDQWGLMTRDEHQNPILSGANISPWHTVGHWGWYLRDAVRFERPVPYRGQQRLYNVPAYLVADQLPEGWAG